MAKEDGVRARRLGAKRCPDTPFADIEVRPNGVGISQIGGTQISIVGLFWQGIDCFFLEDTTRPVQRYDILTHDGIACRRTCQADARQGFGRGTKVCGTE